jgi:K+-sensing histidine kinase KdpD
MLSWKFVEGYFGTRSKSFLLIFNIATILAIGLLDYLTGIEIIIAPFYLIPISCATWFGSRARGLISSVLSVMTIAASSFMAGNKFSHLLIDVWNLLMYLAFFVIFTVVLSFLKKDLEERRRLIAELQQTLGQVKQLSGLLPVCSSCKKIRDDNGDWKQMETYISNHSEVLFSHGICPECIERLYPEQYNTLFDKQ